MKRLPSGVQKYTPSARATAIGATFFCAVHSKMVCFFESAAISSLVMAISSSLLLDRVERLNQIVEDFVAGLESNRHSNESIGDSGFETIGRRHARMTRHGRSRQQRFSASQTRRDYRQGRPSHECIGRGRATFQLEAEHPADAFEQASGTGVLRMTWKSRIIHFFHARMRFERAAYGERAGALVPYPQHQCFKAAVEQNTCVRVQ